MTERMSDLAEKLATSLSRRAFLGSIGRSAFALAGVLGGLLVLPTDVHAGGAICCLYQCTLGTSIQCFESGSCPKKLWVCGTPEPGNLIKHSRCASCAECSTCLGL